MLYDKVDLEIDLLEYEQPKEIRSTTVFNINDLVVGNPVKLDEDPANDEYSAEHVCLLVKDVINEGKTITEVILFDMSNSSKIIEAEDGDLVEATGVDCVLDEVRRADAMIMEFGFVNVPLFRIDKNIGLVVTTIVKKRTV
jgi:hypothetical protein